MDHVVIIGNGITGITTARNLRKLSHSRVSVISSETDHFFSRTALMYIYMGHLTYNDTKPYEDWFWDKNNISRINGFVTGIDPSSKQVTLEKGEVLSYDKLVIATGSKSNKFGWPGQDLKGVQGLFSYPDVQLMEENTAGINHAVIVGGGLIGIEMAEMLQSRGTRVTMLVRESLFWDTVHVMMQVDGDDLGLEKIRNAGLKIESIEKIRPTLEDVFINKVVHSQVALS